ncbi:hypothetical protein F5878DRAFT_633502 [Lentinula raphanica]|uniref:DUF6533 domain-containing protein n=1 Tax=Lentinula raphanica TaxID=153919 RepID=A0AA38NZ37_9AGAR|nr:hypothetical protein F5878DRAFT_633502 [Lentinula raphanica]
MTSVESELEYVQLGNILFSSALALLYYDHLLTLDAESRLIWKRSRNSSRYLFLFNRYFAFFGNIVAAVSLYSSSLSSSSCHSLVIFHQIFMTITQAVISGILTLRVYALYGCRKLFLGFFLGLLLLGTLTTIGIAIASPLSPSNTTYTSRGCRIAPQSSSRGAVTALGWEGILLLDTILFVLTLWKAYHSHLPASTSRVGVSLFVVIVRDGSIYFLVIASLNLINIISYYIPGVCSQ